MDRFVVSFVASNADIVSAQPIDMAQPVFDNEYDVPSPPNYGPSLFGAKRSTSDKDVMNAIDNASPSELESLSATLEAATLDREMRIAEIFQKYMACTEEFHAQLKADSYEKVIFACLCHNKCPDDFPKGPPDIYTEGSCRW